MATVHLEKTFDVAGVSPQQCFDYVTDLDNAGEWNSFVRSATGDAEVAVGRRINAKIQFLVPLPFEVTAEVSRCDEPSDYVITSRVPFTAHLGGHFAPQGDGTRVTYALDMEPTRFFPVPSMVLKRALKGQFERDGKLLRDALQGLR